MEPTPNRSKKIKCSRNTVRIEAGIKIETESKQEQAKNLDQGQEPSKEKI